MNKYECVRISSSGEYYLGIEAFTPSSRGGSIDQLRIGAPGSGTNCSNATGAAALLIPHQIVAQPSEPTRRRLAATASSLEDVVVLKGDPRQPRPVLVQMPPGRSARDSSSQRLLTAAKASRSAQATDQRRQEQADSLIDAWRRPLPPQTLTVRETIDYAKLMVASGEYTHAVPNFRIQATQTRAVGAFPPNDREYVK